MSFTIEYETDKYGMDPSTGIILHFDMKGSIHISMCPVNPKLILDVDIEKDEGSINGLCPNGAFEINWYQNDGIELFVGRYGDGNGGDLCITLDNTYLPSFKNVLREWKSYSSSKNN